MGIHRVLAACVVALLPLPSAAGTLYKSVGPGGTIMFSDIPPADGSRVLERRAMGPVRDAGLPRTSMGAEQMLEVDAAVARANARLDEAERALALARRETWSPREGLRLTRRHATLDDMQRVESHKRDVFIARHALMELLRERHAAQLTTASAPGSPIVVSLSPRRGPG